MAAQRGKDILLKIGDGGDPQVFTTVAGLRARTISLNAKTIDASVVVGGALDEDGLAEADILSGAWDGAGCEAWRVDWRRPDLKVRLWRGTVSKIRREGEAFVADLEGPLAALERVVGRTYGRQCDAVLGDGRCGVDREAFPGVACDKACSRRRTGRRWPVCSGGRG